MVTVQSGAELLAALQSARAGDEILLAGGDYGSVTLKNFNFADTVTLKSINPDDPATFFTLNIQNSSHLLFDGIRVEHQLQPGEADWVTAMRVDRSHHITVVNSEFLGSADGDVTNDVQGFMALDSSHIVLEGNVFHDLRNGSNVSRSTDVVLRDNVYHSIRIDGATFGSVANVVIDGNIFRDFRPLPGDHADMIQIWNTGGVMDLENIAITGNTLDRADGANVQGILVQGVPSGEPGFPFSARNIHIDGNTITAGTAQGIWVYDVAELEITNNVISEATNASLTPTIHVVRSNGAVVTGNTAPAIDIIDSQSVILDQNETEDGSGASNVADPTIYGTAAGDEIFGGDFADVIDGLSGDDRLIGAAGNDTLLGGVGRDMLNGGAGQDALFGGEDDDTIFAGGSADALFGEAGRDVLHGDGGDDVLSGGAGNDRLFGGSDNDSIYGGGGDDRGFGEAGDDLMFGDGGRDMLNGGAGQDTLFGGAGDDLLFGGGGGDVLEGGEGRDSLWGDGGADTLTGGASADVFGFRNGWGNDTITDFEIGIDTIQFSSIDGLTDATELKASLSDQGLVISYGGDSLLLLGVADASVVDGFLFT